MSENPRPRFAVCPSCMGTGSYVPNDGAPFPCGDCHATGIVPSDFYARTADDPECDATLVLIPDDDWRVRLISLDYRETVTWVCGTICHRMLAVDQPTTPDKPTGAPS